MRFAKGVCAALALSFAFVFPPFTTAQEKLPASKIHGYMDIFQALEQSSFYDLTQEELSELHHCAMQKIFQKVRIPKGTTLEEDFVIPSCFPKDKHAAYHTPEGVKQLERQTKGKFFGIGAKLSKVEQGLLVHELVPGGPAEKTKTLQAGDIIVAVANLEESIIGKDVTLHSFVPVKDMPIEKVVERIVGSDGTEVVLKILRGGNEKVVRITRGPVVPQVVESRVLEPSIGYLKIMTFKKKTIVEEDIIPALQKLGVETSLRALVIDLRHNSGGLLPSALEFVELASPGADRLMVEIRTRTQKPVQLKTKRIGPYAALRIAVLVNGGSASASEVTAGVLQIWGAKVVGTQTFGKGSGQNVPPISDGGAVRLTTFKFFFENGKTPDENGITPDIIEKDTPPSSPDTQREKATAYLRDELQPKP